MSSYQKINDQNPIAAYLPVSQAYIDTIMGFTAETPATSEEYIDALWGTCAPNIGVSIPTPSFQTISNNKDKVEKLSILTQFFLAHINIYCAAKNISEQNFGKILDASPHLCNDLVNLVSNALISGASAEESFFTFFNKHQKEFSLNRVFTEADREAIQQKFERTYKTVTATNENPHTDDFMILDTDTAGQFLTHQGSICIDFVVLVEKELDNETFQAIRNDYNAMNDRNIPNKNEHIQANIELDIETFIARSPSIEQIERLPIKIRLECIKSTAFQLRVFLDDVAKGKQDRAEILLRDNPRSKALLLSDATFTDYSGRTFHCTAYEYAYWAKDTLMCRMLEEQMDDETKLNMLKRVEKIEQGGLSYLQNGQSFQSSHFDFTPLKRALENYNNGYDDWDRTDDVEAMYVEWMKVGQEQRNVPAHVAQEYCRTDRAFNPLPLFDERVRQLNLTFYNYKTSVNDYDIVSWFPLDSPIPNELGFKVALYRGRSSECHGFIGLDGHCFDDLAAMSRLDEVRTAELVQSRENLSGHNRSLGMSS